MTTAMHVRKRLGKLLLAGAGLLACAGAGAQVANDCLLGDVRLFAGDFVPVGWMLANGQFLRISDHTALYSLLNTTWGGDGIQYFRLPDLSSRIPVGTGQGPGLSNVLDGMWRGTEETMLQRYNLPPHGHPVVVAGGAATTATPAGGMALAAVPEAGAFATAVPDTTLSASSVGSTGGYQPFERLPPMLALNYIICAGGVYPARN